MLQWLAGFLKIKLASMIKARLRREREVLRTSQYEENLALLARNVMNMVISNQSELLIRRKSCTLKATFFF